MKSARASRVCIFLLLCSLLTALPVTAGAYQDPPPQQDTIDPFSSSTKAVAESVVYIEFGADLPNSVFRIVEVPDGGGDVDVFARDCCIRDDIVEIYVDGCLLAMVDSIGGPSGSHPGETHTVTLEAGFHTVEYRNVQSGVGPSGWYVEETVKPFTGNFWCEACTAASGNAPVTEGIYNFGSCGPEGKKTAKWGHFGSAETLEADSGEKLEIECASVEGGLAFVLYYTPPGGSRLPVGMCPFLSGCNSARFSYTADSDDDKKPNCFVTTRWISRDYVINDNPNLWTGEGEEDPPLLDHADSLFDIGNDNLNRLDHKFKYRYGPPTQPCRSLIGTVLKPEGDWVRSFFVDPSIWPTSASRAGIATELAGITEVEPPPMEASPIQLCDLDWDGDCDEDDRSILDGSLGKCRGEPGYNFEADIDGDGCVTTRDEVSYSIAEITIVEIDVKPGSDPNSINCANANGVITVAVLTTEDFDATTVDHTTVTFEGASETHVDKKTGEPRRHEEDVDYDGDIDLVFHFRFGDTSLTCDSIEATLLGMTFDGQAITGTDEVRMVPGAP